MIDDVVTNVREAFLDDGVDEQILQELRQVKCGYILFDIICYSFCGSS